MDLYSIILENYPQLDDNDFGINGQIKLRDDCDGFGQYITKWEYDKPIPEGLHLGKVFN